MPSPFVVGLRACCVAAVLALTASHAAETKSPSLVGATRSQVLERLGEPRSSIVAGAREVLLFERERVVLRDNVVIEVVALPVEAPRRPQGADPAVDPATQNPTAEAAPDAAGGTTSSTPARGAGASAANGAARDDAPLAIRSVRPAGSAPRPGASPSTPPVAVEAASAAGSTAPLPPSAPALGAAAQTAEAVAAPTPPAKNATPGADSTAASEGVMDSAEKNESAAAEEGVPKDAAAPAVVARGAESVVASSDEGPISGASYLIAFALMLGGVGYLIWRARQRRLELAATAVSRTPFAAPAPAVAGARFSPELLAKLEWKRFEELVVAYYGKTGVVAIRTKSGPGSPVHIKISWKGESRPFAFVHCIPHPTGLVDANPIQDLVTALMAEDIRRGYVVTTGKFSVPARDFAEEKHITLLSGDLLLEKLNALPDGARNELMLEMTNGDFTTPSCPKCEAKMVRSADDPQTWRCPAHPDVALPAWK